MREIMDADDFSWWRRFVHTDDVEASMAQWRHSLETGEPMIEEKRLRRLDSTYLWFRDTGVASRDDQGANRRLSSPYRGHRPAQSGDRAAQQREELRLLIDTVPR
ncbi:PAS domain-containing protein [Mesorhizobium sp. M0051]|uniref:PAS domain-containing protein n=1 Tax=Mesorhizobium sp. M0051 TaxID=2956862 RepID=UPI00333AE132